MDDLKKFIKWYKKLIEGSREDPPPEVWNNISEKLEIDEVWDRMATQMDYEEGIAQYERWSYAPVTALALLALLNGYLLSSRPGVDEYTLQQPELIVELKPMPVEISESITSPFLKNSDRGSNEPILLLQLQSVPVTVNSGYSKPDASIPKLIENREYNPVSKIESIQTTLNIFTKSFSLAGIKPIYEYDLTINRSATRFYLGVTGSLKNTWLLNDNTYKGLESDELIKTLPTFNKEVGVLVGMSFNSRVALQTEASLASISQKYQNYIKGSYLDQTFELTYVQLNPLIKLNFPRITSNQKRLSSNLMAGPYFGLLTSAEETIGENTLDKSETYTHYDYGMVLGYEYEIFPWERISIASGLRIKYGFKNIYTGEGIIPGSFRRTNTGSIDLNIAVKYYFTKSLSN